jgi:hypothetical protein
VKLTKSTCINTSDTVAYISRLEKFVRMKMGTTHHIIEVQFSLHVTKVKEVSWQKTEHRYIFTNITARGCSTPQENINCILIYPSKNEKRSYAIRIFSVVSTQTVQYKKKCLYSYVKYNERLFLVPSYEPPWMRLISKIRNKIFMAFETEHEHLKAFTKLSFSFLRVR